MRRLAVFAGGWRIGAAVAVCAGNGLADWSAPDLLDGLVHKSLVALDERDSAARYTLLETVRAYAAERLAATGEQETVRDRHLAWCLALAEEAEPKLKGAEQGVWLARLEREHDNVRAALDWARERGAAEEGSRLAAALWRFWLARGHLSEGRRRLEAALAEDMPVPDAVRARILAVAGVLAEQQGDYGSAAALHEEALALRRALGDTTGVARALTNLGNVAERQGEYRRAAALLEEGLAIWRALGDTEGIAGSLTNLGNVAERLGDFRRAAALHVEALALLRALGHTWGIALALDNLGIVLCKLGEYERATSLIEESLTLERALGDTQGIAYSLGHLGLIADEQGDRARAAALHEESLALRRELGEKRGIAYSLKNLGMLAERQGDHARATTLLTEGLQLSRQIGARDAMADILASVAHVAAAAGRPKRAALLGGAAAALREATGRPAEPEQGIDHVRTARSLRAALGKAAYAAAWAEGHAMPLDEAVALALDVPPRADE